jgi:hypothetical protein
MTQSTTWLASAAVIALTLGVTSRADVPMEKELPLPPGSIIIAANEAAGQTEDNAEESAKMGKEAGTHEGAGQGATPESDSAKMDQPARRGAATGDGSGDYNGTSQ